MASENGNIENKSRQTVLSEIKTPPDQNVILKTPPRPVKPVKSFSKINVKSVNIKRVLLFNDNNKNNLKITSKHKRKLNRKLSSKERLRRL